MRNDILFKAKAIEEGMDWLIGSIVVTDIIPNSLFPISMPTDHYQIMHYCADDPRRAGWKLFDIDPNTICQFTGLIDKNGNKVWEGDIVCFDDTPYSIYASAYTGEVVRYKGCWCVKHKLYDHYVYPPLFRDDFADRKTEVLGNKFDNPELLTQND